MQSNGVYHFYAAIDTGSSEEKTVVIQRVDVGIGAVHFHLTALEKDFAGKFEKLADPETAAPKNLRYLFSWIPEKR